MLYNFFANSADLRHDINNFLKNDRDITNDFKTRVVTASMESENFKKATRINYTRVINKMDDAECIAFLSDKSLFMEENY